MKSYVLDANALITLFEDRPGAATVEELLRKETQQILMSVINWGEVYYSVWRSRGQAVAEEKIEQIAQLPIQVVDAESTLVKLAAGLKAEYNLPYADCFAAALAGQRNATLVTGDKDFRKVEKNVPILWTNAR